MKQTTHTRKGKQIIDLTTGVVEDFKSVNQAKYRSRAIQMAADNALGRGTVRKLYRKFKERTVAWGPSYARRGAL